jgi:hypothetical protein
LIASKLHLAVNDKLSAIAFNENGMVINEQLPILKSVKGEENISDEYFKNASQPLESTNVAVHPLSLPIKETVLSPVCTFSTSALSQNHLSNLFCHVIRSVFHRAPFLSK